MQKWRKRGFFGLAAVLVIWGAWTQAGGQVIGPIPAEVKTDFGTYRPPAVTVTPSLQARTPSDGLLDVGNLPPFSLTEAEIEALQRNGFVMTPSGFRQIYALYKDAKERGLPVFVTTDALLHTFHVLYDYTLRVLEVRQFCSDLEALSLQMLDRMQRDASAAFGPAVRDALRRNAAYFSVGLSLMGASFEMPGEVRDFVEAELALIAGHAGLAASPIFGYEEDYSQYVPRGHYTRTEELGRFFKAMMWYGRMGFHLRKVDGSPNREETLRALLIARALGGETVKGEPALAVWDRIYEPTAFFVGESDDLTAREYLDLAPSVYGDGAQARTADALGDTALVDAFVAAADALRNPLIISSAVDDTAEDPEASTKGFRFMGQRFVPDSYMFQQLVYTHVGTRSAPRLFPMGLDVMAVLGSEAAFALLDKVYNETGYWNYRTQMDKLKGEFAAMPADAWAQNLYWNWLYCLLPMLEPKGEGYPAFMQGDGWIRKGLNTALGSWAELRHDTILYAKQSYTVRETAVPTDVLTFGYVEPAPDVFGRLAALAALMRDGLSLRGLLLTEFGGKLSDLESLCLSLKTIAEKELTATERTEAEYRTIWTIGAALENLVTFSEEISGEVTNATDQDMAVIADVHTDLNSGRVLEVGVGRPFALYAVVEEQGEFRAMVGGAFSYYEFKQPLSDRLTDEAWQTQLEGGEASGIPVWMGDQTVGSRLLEPEARPEGQLVDFSVFLAFVKSMNAKAGEPNYRQVFDFDHNGAIEFSDFLTFAGSYNRVVYWSGL